MAALPALVLALSPGSEQSVAETGAVLERGNGVEALVSVVLRGGAGSGVAGVLAVLRLPSLLAPHVGGILAHSGVRQSLQCRAMSDSYSQGGISVCCRERVRSQRTLQPDFMQDFQL